MSRRERRLLVAAFALTTLVVPCAAQVGGATERSTKSPTSYQLIDRALSARSITQEIAGCAPTLAAVRAATTDVA